MLRIKAEFAGAVAGEDSRKVYTFRASTSAVDRQNEVVDQSGWQLESYRLNPVILDSHKYGSIDDIIGKASRVEATPQGLEVDIEFTKTEKGMQAEQLVEDGFLRTVSVGFRSLDRKPGRMNEPMVHLRSELLEISLVAIPANREAVRIRSVDDLEAKAGRRLSKNTSDKLRLIMSLLEELLADEDEGEYVGGNKPMADEKPKAYEVARDTLAALRRFTEEAKNG